jgi:hypothetical protein
MIGRTASLGQLEAIGDDIQIARDGSIAAMKSHDRSLVTLDIAAMKPIGGWNTKLAVVAFTLSPDGKRLVVGGAGAIRIMDPKTGGYLIPTVQTTHVWGSQYFRFTPDGRQHLSTDLFSCIVLDAKTAQPKARFEVTTKDPTAHMGGGC